MFANPIQSAIDLLSRRSPIFQQAAAELQEAALSDRKQLVAKLAAVKADGEKTVATLLAEQRLAEAEFAKAVVTHQAAQVRLIKATSATSNAARAAEAAELRIKRQLADTADEAIGRRLAELHARIQSIHAASPVLHTRSEKMLEGYRTSVVRCEAAEFAFEIGLIREEAAAVEALRFAAIEDVPGEIDAIKERFAATLRKEIARQRKTNGGTVVVAMDPDAGESEDVF